jgi:hypothetical protein
MRPIYNLCSANTAGGHRSRSIGHSSELDKRERRSLEPQHEHLPVSPFSPRSYSLFNNCKSKQISYKFYSKMTNESANSNIINSSLNTPTTPYTGSVFQFQYSSSPAVQVHANNAHKRLVDSPALTSISSNIDTTSLYSPSKILKQQKIVGQLPFKDRFNYPFKYDNDERSGSRKNHFLNSNLDTFPFATTLFYSVFFIIMNDSFREQKYKNLNVSSKKRNGLMIVSYMYLSFSIYSDRQIDISFNYIILPIE